MLVYLCLSSHGFGHAARQAAVFNELHKLQPDWRLVVSSIVDINFLSLVFKGIPIEYRRVEWDIGVVQKNALDIDFLATLRRLEHIEKVLPTIIKSEAKWIKSQDLPTIIIGDIPPSASQLALEVDCDLVWMGNFGWDDIYADMGSLFRKFTQIYRENYSKGKFLLRCPFSLKMEWNLPETSLGLVAAKPNPIPVYFEAKLRAHTGPIVLIGFGGFGLDIPLNLYENWPNHLFILPDVNNIKGSSFNTIINNTIYLPNDIRTLDILPYCSRFIGKPGFSSFCEALSQRVGLHVISRENFAEVRVLMEGLKSYGHHLILDRTNLENGDWKLDQSLESPSKNVLLNDGAITAAKSIINIFITNRKNNFVCD